MSDYRSSYEEFWKRDDPYGHLSCSQFKARVFVTKTSMNAKNDILLDIGCGDGYLSSKIRTMCNFMVCVDISRNAIKQLHARFRTLDLNFVVATSETLPFRSDSFNTILATEIIEHVQKPRLLLQEIERTLKTDGYAIISTPNKNRLGNKIKAMLKIRVPSMEQHLREYSIRELADLLLKCNLQPSTIKTDWVGVGLPWRKRILHIGIRLGKDVATMGVVSSLGTSIIVKCIVRK